MLSNFVEALLPKGLLDHFSIDGFEEVKEECSGEPCYRLYLSEKNIVPAGHSPSEYQSKGFYPSKTIQDFPIRGKALYLVIKRRRWRHKVTKKEVRGDYGFIAKGVKLTAELSDFLKGTGRDPGGYH